MIYSIIYKSQLEGANRLDAEYYQPDYLSWLEQLKNFKLLPLKRLAEKIDVGFVSSMTDHFQNTGIPLLRTQNVKQFFIDLESGLVYIDQEFHKKLRKTQIFPQDVLLARSGSIGDACIVPNNFPEANSADIISIRKLRKIMPGYLTAFLNSKYGRFQIERGVSGGLQGHINLFSLEKLLIPILHANLQNKIKKIVLNGLKEIENSKTFYSQAEDLLLKELGLKDFEPKDELSYIVNFSEVNKANRMDAEYFMPKHDKLIQKINKYNLKPLLEVVKNIKGKFNPKAKPEEAFKYIELNNIDTAIGVIEGFSKFLGKDAPNRAKQLLKKDDVIISSVEGSLGKAAIIKKKQDGYLASTGFFQFRAIKIIPEYLLVLAKSMVLQMQLKKNTSGTILTALSVDSLKELSVPILSKSIQQKIASLVKKSHESRKKSKELLEKAKKMVENMIEKNEN